MDWFDLTALELGAKIQAGEVSAVDAARACLARIEEKEPTVHAFVTVTPEAALAVSTEPWFVERIYRKLNEKVQKLLG